MRSGKAKGGAVGVLLVVIVLGYGIYSGALTPEQALREVLGETSGGGAGQPSGSGPSTAEGAPPAPPPGEARRLLSRLAVAPEGSMSGYSREEFPHWSDAGEFGWRVADPSCDARDAALIRDGRRVEIGEGCDVASGRWLDPYTGTTYTDPSEIDIDHFVPLANAWRSGASAWDAADRETYANDPGVLLSTEDNANQEKGDKGPEAWRPENGDYHCEYARRWISIKANWNLSVNKEERAALDEMLGACPT